MEGLAWEGGVIASWSHDDVVRLWDGSVFQGGEGEADDESEIIDTAEMVRKQGEGVMDVTGDDDDDDEWEDMEDSEDERDGKPYAMKTESERFFEDL